MTITVSAEKIQEVLQVLEHGKFGGHVDLGPYFPLLIGSLQSHLMLFNLLSSGGNVAQVRKLFGMASSRRQSKGDDSSQNNNHGSKCDNSTNVSNAGDSPVENPDGKNLPAVDETSSGDGRAEQNNNQSSKGDEETTCGENSQNGNKSNRNSNHRGKVGVNDYPDAKVCQHNHDSLNPGDPCPECGRGKVYLCKPRERLLFEGQAPITPIHHIFNDLACSLCKKVFRATPSNQAVDDGLGEVDRYGYSAIAMISILKFFSFLPYYRLDRLTNMLGFRVPDSSQVDQIEKMANALAPIHKHTFNKSSDARLLMADDASGRILDKPMDLIPVRSTGKLEVRDGCHSSVALAFDENDRMSVLIKTDIIHAGEWLDQILESRSTGLSAPQIMWDRISSNTVTVCPYIDIACNQHARQNFKNLREQMPKTIDKILSAYKRIFFNDSQTHTQNDIERLSYHQRNSKCVFESIIKICKETLENKSVTENSELGKAFQYVLKHQETLSGFLKYPGAPLSNNLTERVILYLVLLRRVSHFFRTPASAAIADTILSVGLTAFLNGVNLFHYFRLVMLHSHEVRKQPEQWMPDRFLERYPEYEIKYNSRAGSWPVNPDIPYIPLQPPA